MYVQKIYWFDVFLSYNVFIWFLGVHAMLFSYYVLESTPSDFFFPEKVVEIRCHFFLKWLVKINQWNHLELVFIFGNVLKSWLKSLIDKVLFRLPISSYLGFGHFCPISSFYVSYWICEHRVLYNTLFLSFYCSWEV